MDRVEAREILDRRIAQLRKQSYEDLRDTWLKQPDSEDHFGAGGAWYQVEIEAFWDDKKKRHLLVLASTNLGGWRDMVVSFVIAPDGSFIGE